MYLLEIMEPVSKVGIVLKLWQLCIRMDQKILLNNSVCLV